MSIELPADLKSRVADYAEEAGLAPEEAVRILVEDGLRRKRIDPTKRGPRAPLPLRDPERSIGAFANMSNFVELVAEVIAGRAERYEAER